MRTKEKERADWATTDWCPDEEGCYDEEGAPRLGGITFCVNDVTARLLADVNDSTGILRDLLTEAEDASCDWDFQMLRESVREACRPYLEEPKS